MTRVLPPRSLALGFGVIVLLGACTNSPEVQAGSTTTATASTGEATVSTPENPGTEEPAETDPTPSPTTAPLTPEEEAGLVESSLPNSTAPLVTTADDIEPKPAIGADALAGLLVDQLEGFQPVDAPEADRFLDVEAASALQPDPTQELPLLQTRGYQGGWTRAFRNDNNDVVVATVYDFISALEADFYLEDGTITIIGFGGTIYEVEAIPGARGFRQDVTEGGEALVIYGITFTRNNQWYLVSLLGNPETAEPSLALAAAMAQAQAAG